jgi:Zn ribbon nucleic-acid-binding protein
MKVMIVVCKQCGHEKRIEVYNHEEAERKRIQIAPPKREKCGSANVILRG